VGGFTNEGEKAGRQEVSVCVCECEMPRRLAIRCQNALKAKNETTTRTTTTTTRLSKEQAKVQCTQQNAGECERATCQREE